MSQSHVSVCFVFSRNPDDDTYKDIIIYVYVTLIFKLKRKNRPSDNVSHSLCRVTVVLWLAKHIQSLQYIKVRHDRYLHVATMLGKWTGGSQLDDFSLLGLVEFLVSTPASQSKIRTRICRKNPSRLSSTGDVRCPDVLVHIVMRTAREVERCSSSLQHEKLLKLFRQTRLPIRSCFTLFTFPNSDRSIRCPPEGGFVPGCASDVLHLAAVHHHGPMSVRMVPNVMRQRCRAATIH
ncbi:hypothetical protein F2P81_023564 [Scophthalmus maximus]|uniref:Uncharacterized protein n=1 Tax=Scophthalmus maximus TaxID=52904 RepID=A0A6A4RZZ9_SCOMX|nr:hypothetical protein F2P81_023564 [Scophthalmus maximus]